MDRRQERTRRAIFQAFYQLLEKKSYGKITVQNILDIANIGRSTFYAHFETKDKLLEAMCQEIFSHVFDENLGSEAGHDFSHEGKNLKSTLTHILYHLKEEEMQIKRLLQSESGRVFFNYLENYLEGIFMQYLVRNAADFELALDIYTKSFSLAVKWWILKRPDLAPEDVEKSYMEHVRIGV